MKDAAAKMKRWTTSEEDALAAIERKSRAAAIRRAVKAERERCVKCVEDWQRNKLGHTTIIEAINTPAKKRPSRKRK